MIPFQLHSDALERDQRQWFHDHLSNFAAARAQGMVQMTDVLYQAWPEFASTFYNCVESIPMDSPTTVMAYRCAGVLVRLDFNTRPRSDAFKVAPL